MKIEMEGLVDLHKEDGGLALIAENIEHDPDALNGMFVRLQSWDDAKQHKTLRAFAGKKVRVTVEVIA